ncbi:MAG: hypothetical protein SEPTF4163_006429 [Sporothrix epigloea]
MLRRFSFVGVLFCLLGVFGFVRSLSTQDDDKADLYMWHQRRAMTAGAHRLWPRMLANDSSIQKAEKLVADAVTQQSAYNAYRVAHPRRNKYTTRPTGASYSTDSSRKRSGDKDDDEAPAAPVLSPQLKAAAALLAEHHARQQQANGTLHRSYNTFRDVPRPLKVTKRDDSAGPFWPSLVDHGLPPMGSNSSYLVYRDVTDPLFGAKGDGVTDDTAAINAAIAYGNNCEQNCESSTTKGTFIYFPPGTYLISTPINAAYYSQLVGDHNDLPIIQTSPSFIGLGAIQTDVYIPNGYGAEWYVEQSNFYRQVRNLIIDIQGTTTGQVAGLHWQVAQATSLTNVYIQASTAADTTQMGMFTENGSGGFMSDVTIAGGQYGIFGGNQQYTVRNFQISGQINASICLIWDWGWTWSGLYLEDAPIGLSLINPQDATGQQAGSTYFLDSQFVNTPTAILATYESQSMVNTSIITLDNIALSGVDTVVSFTNGTRIDFSDDALDFVIIGNVENMTSMSQGYYQYDFQSPPPALLDSNATAMYHDVYFYKSRPQYESLTLSDIVSVKDHGAKGDGATDDTAAITAALALATTDNLIYFPPGSYIVTSTIVIPANARLTGQVWSQIVASGDYFANMTSPKVMVQVGNAGDVGTVEISDLLFTSIGSLPGLVLVEWNVQAETQGSVGIWDAHFRVGGAYGSKLQVAECPSSAALNTDSCVAASTMMHMTPGSNGYFENMWLWVADHDIDDASNTQISVAVARGLLLDSTAGPTWMFGTASEHSMLYQYNFYNTTNTLAGMIQTESPYFQFADTAQSPGPFNSSVGLFAADPIFPDASCEASSALCDFAWAVVMDQNTNLTVAGAGLYSWYDDYLEECVDTQNCQQRLVLDSGDNAGLFIFNLVTIGAVEMISNVGDADIVYAANNTQSFGHPYWSALAAYVDDGSQGSFACDDDDDSDECNVSWTCDLTQNYDSVDALNAALSYPDQCMPYYAINTLYNILNDTMANYTVTNSKYDKYFGDYQQYVREMVPEAIATFIAPSSPAQVKGGAGNQYFNCTCTGCGTTAMQQCPFTHSQLAGLDNFVITYTLTDADGFYSALESTYGINKTWVTFGNTGHYIRNHIRCLPGDECSLGYDQRYVNIPLAADEKNIQVANPKDFITAAMPSISGMQDNILVMSLNMIFDNYNGSMQDVCDTFSQPVLLIKQAVESMAVVKTVGEKQAKSDKIRLILEILGIVFAILPFVDDILPALEVVGGAFAVVATAGNVALDIQGIISDPSSAPMILLDLVGGKSGSELTDGDDFAKVAAAARAVKENDLAAIGADFKAEVDKFNSITKPHCEV